MDLRTAVSLVSDDARDAVEPGMTDQEAVAYHRSPVTGVSHNEVDSVVDDLELREAYHLVLDAAAGDLAQVTG